MTGLQGLANALRVVHAQGIQHDHLARLERWRQLLRDVPGERHRIHGSFNQPGLVHAVGGERRHQRRILPVVARRRAGGALVMLCGAQP